MEVRRNGCVYRGGDEGVFVKAEADGGVCVCIVSVCVYWEKGQYIARGIEVAMKCTYV